MPIELEKAKSYLIIVAEENYKYDLDDETFDSKLYTILTDIIDPHNSEIWVEEWIVSQSQEARDSPANAAHELHGRSWRILR